MQVDLERIFVITNFIFELPSVVFDQLFLSINRFDLVLFTRVKGKMLHGSGALPWLYYPSPSDKLFGNFNDIVGLVCALCQCILSAITYGFVRRHADNPIKVSVWPIIFAFGLLCSNLFKKPENRSSVS
ncbi:hypothetical protein CISIN_1g038928mg [Citrus sinensis]|uniref:Uncharacterized protein n=1 Tax=Citrus sinensis TaxID=2711 RepID=A0A067F9C4_CITSI|nr:hypothetical protein CISIN_1g038928mg [Citrus sinensis]